MPVWVSFSVSCKESSLTEFPSSKKSYAKQRRKKISQRTAHEKATCRRNKSEEARRSWLESQARRASCEKGSAWNSQPLSRRGSKDWNRIHTGHSRVVLRWCWKKGGQIHENRMGIPDVGDPVGALSQVVTVINWMYNVNLHGGNNLVICCSKLDVGVKMWLRLLFLYSK